MRRAGVWAVMAAYNRVDGRHCSEHLGLLTDLLRGEWGFDGVVMSDWFGTHSPAALAAGLDLEMPGPAAGARPPPDRGGRGRRRHGRRRSTRPASGCSTCSNAPHHHRVGGHRARHPAEVARAAATEAIVLLANDGVLPWIANRARRSP